MTFSAKKLAAVFCGGVLFFAAVFVWARFVEPAMLTVTKIEAPLSVWAGTQKRIRAVALADLHLANSEAEENRLARIVEKTLAQAPDVVFLLGDYVKGTKRANMMSAEKIAAGLKPLADRVPVFACYGNHDAFYGNVELRKTFVRNGIRLIRKGELFFAAKRTGAEMRVVMTLDPDSFGAVPDIFPEKYSAAAPEGTPTVVLSHSPDVFPLLESLPFSPDFVFCGHTHGGQICLPGGVALTTSTRVVGTDFAYGLKAIPGGGKMFVSRGLGTSILPMRLFCPPEILVVDFVPAF